MPPPHTAPAGLAGPALGSAVPGDTYSFLDRSAAPAYDPSPRSGNGATPTAAAPVASSGALPFALNVSVLDLSGLGFQHNPGLGAPAAGITGVRPFDPYAIKRDFPILQQNVNGRPLVWLDNAATTQKPQSGDRSPRRTSTSTRTPTSTAPRTRWRRARPTPTRRRATRCARFINAPSPERSSSCAARPRASTSSPRLGRPQRRGGRRDRHHASRAPRQHRALAAARRREGRRAARRAGRRHRADHPRRVREAARAADARRLDDPGLERARHDHAGRRR